MGRVRLILALLGIIFASPLSALADATPQTTPAAACAFPPISVDLLREMRDEIAADPPPTPTPEVNYASPRTHLMPFPPPAGDPIDDVTADSIREFLADYADCVRAGRLASTYGAWTEDFIFRSLNSEPERADALTRVIEMEAESPMFAHPEIQRLLLLRAWRIETGHVVAVVQIVGVEQYWTMLLIRHDDSWRIDDMWSLGPRMIGDNLTGPVYGTPVSSVR